MQRTHRHTAVSYIVSGCCRASRTSDTARNGAVGSRNDIRTLRIACARCRLAGVSHLHYLLPCNKRMVGGLDFKRRRVLISKPAAGNIIRGTSAEISILVITGSTGFRKDRISAECGTSCRTVAARYRRTEHTVHNRCRFKGNSLSVILICMLDQNLVVCIENL